MNENDMRTKTTERKWLRTFLYIAAFVVVVQVGGCIGIQHWQDVERGTFGDMFGAINTLFSGLAFAALVVTVLMQRDELKLQFEELEKSRKEFEKTASAQQNMLLLAQDEKNSREARERRAATLTLYPWKKHEGEQREEGVIAWRFSATNLGATVTDIQVHLDSSTRVGGLSMNHCPILPTQGKMTITFRQIDEETIWDTESNWPTARFRVEYVDTTGARRFQLHELQKYDGGTIACIDLGIEQID